MWPSDGGGGHVCHVTPGISLGGRQQWGEKAWG